MDPLSFYKASIEPYLLLARPYNALALLFSFSVGVSLSSCAAAKDILIGMAVLIAAHSAWTIQNDIYDMRIDRDNGRKSPLLSGQVTMAQCRTAVLLLYGFCFAFASLSTQKYVFLLFIFTFFVLGWAYNAPPLQVSRRPLGSILLLGCYYAAAACLFGFLIGDTQFNAAFYVILLCLTLVRMSTSILKDFKDEAGDRKHHKHTFLIRYGAKKVAVLALVVSGLGYAGFITYALPQTVSAAVHMLGYLLLLLGVGTQVFMRVKLLRAASSSVRSKIFEKIFVGENYINGALLICFLQR